MLTALGVTGAAEDPLLDIVISNVQYRVQNETNRKDILTFQRYAKRRDLLSVLLEDGKEYTMEQVDSLLQNFFKKGKVN